MGLFNFFKKSNKKTKKEEKTVEEIHTEEITIVPDDTNTESDNTNIVDNYNQVEEKHIDTRSIEEFQYKFVANKLNVFDGFNPEDINSKLNFIKVFNEGDNFYFCSDKGIRTTNRKDIKTVAEDGSDRIHMDFAVMCKSDKIMVSLSNTRDAEMIVVQ